jgi:hypothetical protein
VTGLILSSKISFNCVVVKFGVPTKIWFENLFVFVLLLLSSPLWLYFGIQGWRQAVDNFRRPLPRSFRKPNPFLIQLNNSLERTPLWGFLGNGFIILLGIFCPYAVLISPAYLVFDGKSLWQENFLQIMVVNKIPYRQVAHFDFSDQHRAKSGTCYRCNLDLYNKSNQSIFRIPFSSEAEAIQMRNKLLHELRAKGMHPR